MDRTVLIALANNAALLLVLSLINDISYWIPKKFNRFRPIVTGLLIAFICYIVMSIPFTLYPGLVFDTRSILISVVALTFGLVPTAITAVAAATIRIFMGGDGTLPGLAVIVSSALIGLAWRRWLFPKNYKWRWLNVYAMSIAVHTAMLACMFLLPSSDSLSVIQTIAMPVMLVYPIASVLLSLLLIRRQELRRIQDQLRQSEERFKILFDKAPLGYQSLDFDGYFIDVNQQWLDTLGYSREEVIGKWFGDFLSPDFRERFRQRFPEFKKNGNVHSEFEMISKNGKPIFIAFEGKIGYDRQGEFKQTHCILQDITEQRRAEEDLRISEEKYRRLFETMAQGVVYQAADGSIISANPAAERILGLTFDQMQGKTSADETWKAIREDGSELPGSEHPAMIALRTGRPFGPFIMGVYQSQTHEHSWLSITAIPLFHPGESVPYQVYTTFQDITAERKANQNYQLLFDEMKDAFALHEIVCDEQGSPVDYRFLAVNPAFEQMTGLHSADILGKSVLEVLPDTEPYWIETYGKVALTGEPVRFENYSAAADKYFEVRAYQPAPGQFACTFSDFTNRIMAEIALRESEQKYSSYIENAPDGILVVDEDGRFIEANHAATLITGYNREELLCINNQELIAEESMESGIQLCRTLLETGSADGEILYKHRDGSRRWAMVDVVRLSENRFLSFISDVTDRKMAEENLYYISEHDYLTGLYNRRYFDEAVKRFKENNETPLSIIIGNINGLKLINDVFGREEGDKIITETARFLRDCCRGGDIAARTGGDEFSVLLPGTDNSTTFLILDQIKSAFDDYNREVSNEALHISISLGLGTKTSDQDDLTLVIKSAEDNMNQRKLLESKSSHSAIIASIRAAIHEKSNETEAHSARLIMLSRKIGAALGLSDSEMDNLELLAMLHDVGKVGIPDKILNKQGKLSENEMKEMRKHPEIGYRIARTSPELVSIAEYILCHHEHWDGTGYPQNLGGENIPLISRALAVIDAYDAMTQGRPYYKARSHEETILELERCAGTQFDPEIVRIFSGLFKEDPTNTGKQDKT